MYADAAEELGLSAPHSEVEAKLRHSWLTLVVEEGPATAVCSVGVVMALRSGRATALRRKDMAAVRGSRVSDRSEGSEMMSVSVKRVE